jgi:hypothetical protein
MGRRSPVHFLRDHGIGGRAGAPVPCSLLVVVLFLVLVLPAAAEAHHDFRFSPEEGGTKTTFALEFTADVSETGTVDDPVDFYVVEITGPQGCREAAAFTTDRVAAGEHVRVPIRPFDIDPFFEARQWCPGRYAGSVSFHHSGAEDPRPDLPVGRFEFTIRGPGNYAGETSQGKGLRFTLGGNGSRLTGLRFRDQLRCQDRQGRFTMVAPPGRFPAISVRNGRFRETFRARAGGVRRVVKIAGRLAGGTFQGRLRDQAFGPGFRCDSGPMSWSAS